MEKAHEQNIIEYRQLIAEIVAIKKRFKASKESLLAKDILFLEHAKKRLRSSINKVLK